MTSLVCNKRKYILSFSLFIFALFSTWGMPKQVFRTRKQQKAAIIRHFDFFQTKSEIQLSAACSLYTKAECYRNETRFFTDRYYLLKSKLVYLPDFYFSDISGVLELSQAYIPELDDGSWLDEVLVEVEEQRIAEEISGMDNRSDDYKYESFDGEQRSQEIENALNGEETEQYFYDKQSQLSRMSFEKEIFQISKNSEGFISIHKNENQVQRLFYDLNYRTIRKEIWDKDASVNLSNYSYEYDEGELNPSKKITEQLTSEPPLKQITAYTKNGLVSSSQKYVLVKKTVEKDTKETEKTEKTTSAEEKEASSKAEEEITVQKMTEDSSWQYDKQDRVVKSFQKTYTYTDNTYEILKDVFEKKYVYMYHKQSSEKSEDEVPADTEYYEDNVLRMRLVYTNKNSYTKQYFFDNDFNVTSCYVEDKLTKEVYRAGKKVLRIKTYDD